MVYLNVLFFPGIKVTADLSRCGRKAEIADQNKVGIIRTIEFIKKHLNVFQRIFLYYIIIEEYFSVSVILEKDLIKKFFPHIFRIISFASKIIKHISFNIVNFLFGKCRLEQHLT